MSRPEEDHGVHQEPDGAGTPDVVSGLFLAALGLAVVIEMALNHPIGSLVRMRLGYFPLAVGAIMACLGAVIALSGLRNSKPLPDIEWQVCIAVVVGLLLFAAAIPTVGLVPGIFLMTIAATLPDSKHGLLMPLVVSAVMSLVAWLVFVLALDLQMPLLRLPW